MAKQMNAVLSESPLTYLGDYVFTTPLEKTDGDLELIATRWHVERKIRAARIRRQIAKGTYRVSSQSLAKRILNLD
jgi:hypothetical protein